MGVDWFLVVTAVLVTVLVIGVMLMILVYFQSPDDRNDAWIPKGVVLFGLYLAAGMVLILPFDVANARTNPNNRIDMHTLWSIAMIATAVMLFLIMPFAYFYYENDMDPNEDTSGCCGCCPWVNGQFCEGVKWSLGFFFCFGVILAATYVPLRWAELPIQRRTYNFNSLNNRLVPGATLGANIACGSTSLCIEDGLLLKIEVTFPVFVMALMAFIGWFLFVCFAGIGIPALPFDLVNEFRTRPTPLSKVDYDREKKRLAERAKLIQQAGEALRRDELNASTGKRKGKEKREFNAQLRRFENAAYFLKRDYNHLWVSFKLRGGNPFVYVMKLVTGIIGGSISLMWVVHIVVFMLLDPPPNPMLNSLFIALELPGFALMGVIAFAFYSMWLLFCVIKGNFRFGLQIPLLPCSCCTFKFYPMEIGNTLMNSFLVNTWLILLCSVVVVQFCAMAFPVYARNTEIDLLFGTQIRYLQFFNYFFNNNVFIYILLVFVLLAMIGLVLCPKDQNAEVEAKLQSIGNAKRSDLGLEMMNI